MAEQVKLLIRLEPELRRQLRMEAARSGLSVTELVRQAVRAWLEGRERERDREVVAEALANLRREREAAP